MSNDNNDARGPLSPNPQRNAVTNEALDGTLDALRPEMVPHLFRRAVVRGLVTPADGQPGPPVSGQPEPPVSGQPGPPVSGQPEPPVSGQPEPPVSGQPGPPVSGQVATPAVSSVPVDEEDWTPNPATISHGFVSSSIPPVAPIDDWSEYSVSMPTPAVAPTPGTNQPPAV
uniref:Uncharacterized protein n=1 Tax=Panagrolaimus sp. ES5 TaxID=591445 RepID=A0AC34FFM7_9BILA